jgi:hypothetical protein
MSKFSDKINKFDTFSPFACVLLIMGKVFLRITYVAIETTQKQPKATKSVFLRFLNPLLGRFALIFYSDPL